MQHSIEYIIKNAYSAALHAQKRQVILSPSTIAIFYGFLKDAYRQELKPETRKQAVVLEAVLRDHSKYTNRMETFSSTLRL
jgi:hypothetical protein